MTKGCSKTTHAIDPSQSQPSCKTLNSRHKGIKQTTEERIEQETTHAIQKPRAAREKASRTIIVIQRTRATTDR
jgi:hypothetical protein